MLCAGRSIRTLICSLLTPPDFDSVNHLLDARARALPEYPVDLNKWSGAERKAVPTE